ncbi:hypothetical protein Q2T40_20970 [Winogradskyella maritima]|nr:hypothetical protein [Winogradskyella maritima]
MSNVKTTEFCFVLGVHYQGYNPANSGYMRNNCHGFSTIGIIGVKGLLYVICKFIGSFLCIICKIIGRLFGVFRKFFSFFLCLFREFFRRFLGVFNFSLALSPKESLFSFALSIASEASLDKSPFPWFSGLMASSPSPFQNFYRQTWLVVLVV